MTARRPRRRQAQTDRRATTSSLVLRRALQDTPDWPRRHARSDGDGACSSSPSDEATKLVPVRLTADDKAYETTVRLGVGTDSLDAEGHETPRARRSWVSFSRRSRRQAGGAPCPRSILASDRDRVRTYRTGSASVLLQCASEANARTRWHGAVKHRSRGAARRATPIEVRGGGTIPEPHLRLALDVTKGYFVRSLAAIPRPPSAPSALDGACRRVRRLSLDDARRGALGKARHQGSAGRATRTRSRGSFRWRPQLALMLPLISRTTAYATPSRAWVLRRGHDVAFRKRCRRRNLGAARHERRPFVIARDLAEDRSGPPGFVSA